MKEFLSSAKVRVSMVGGVIILATAYGTCSFDPNEEAIKEKVEDSIQEDAPQGEDIEAKEAPKADAQVIEATEVKPSK